jgi:hypothetical protein
LTPLCSFCRVPATAISFSSVFPVVSLQHRSPWSDAAVSSNCPLAPTLFYCLLNAGLAYDPIGWGVPYGSALVSDFDEPLADMSLQVLTALLDYAPFVNRRTGAALSPAGVLFDFPVALLCVRALIGFGCDAAAAADEAEEDAERARSDGETSQGTGTWFARGF